MDYVECTWRPQRGRKFCAIDMDYILNEDPTKFSDGGAQFVSWTRVSLPAERAMVTQMNAQSIDQDPTAGGTDRTVEG